MTIYAVAYLVAMLLAGAAFFLAPYSARLAAGAALVLAIALLVEGLVK